MSYVPIVPHVPSPPSPRTRELADRVAKVLIEFEQTHPTVTAQEIQEALRIALRSTGRSNVLAGPLIVGLTVALVAGVVVALAVGEVGLPEPTAYPMVAIVSALLIVLALVAAFRRRP